MLTVLMLVRVSILANIPTLGLNKRVWVYAILLETFVAAFAPFVAHQLWYERRTVTWWFTLLFHIIAILSAITTIFFEQRLPLTSLEESSQVVLIQITFGMISVIALWFLNQQSVKNYYRGDRMEE